MRSLIVIALTLATLAAAGCSENDDADPTTTPEQSTTLVETSEPAPTITPSTLPPTSQPEATTTEAPTTTLDPTQALIADIEADLNAGEQALMNAGADPSNPELRSEVARYFADAGLARVTDFLDGLGRDGLVNRPNPDVPNRIVVVRVIESLSDNEALVEICRIDAAVVYEPIGTAEAIVNDQILRTRSQVRFTQADEIWVSRGDGDILDTTEGATECA